MSDLFYGVHCWRPTLWEKVRLFFVRGQWFKDGDYAGYFKRMGGKVYLMKERLTKAERTQQAAEFKDK